MRLARSATRQKVLDCWILLLSSPRRAAHFERVCSCLGVGGWQFSTAASSASCPGMPTSDWRHGGHSVRCSLPLILRREAPETHRLVGESYIYGASEGVFDRQQEAKSERFTLVWWSLIEDLVKHTEQQQSWLLDEERPTTR